MPERSFAPALFRFLRDLEANNSREWFEANRERFEDDVKEPALAFISAFGPKLRRISPEFLAIPRVVKGSLFRIHRDTRFSKDKSPYKTYVGIQFRHRASGDVHAPGFYLHLQRGECFAGVGMWHPEKDALAAVRDALVADPAAWKRARAAKGFLAAGYELEGSALKRPPRGYDPEHPLVEDLKRKDFIAVVRMPEKRVTAPGFLDDYTALCAAAKPFIRFLCRAVGVAF